jgi:alkyl sulfatase BDS1-like metallo-beta-lactamase superfamily hydrolase
LCNRKDIYPIPTGYKQEEIRIINTIMHNNGYTTHNTRKKRNVTPVDTRKWTTFTYVGRETNRLCGLVDRVLGYRSGGPGSIPCTTKKKKKSSGSGMGCTQPRKYKLRSYLIEK